MPSEEYVKRACAICRQPFDINVKEKTPNKRFFCRACLISNELYSESDLVSLKNELSKTQSVVQELKNTIKRLENLLFKFQNGTFVDITEVIKQQKEIESLKKENETLKNDIMIKKKVIKEQEKTILDLCKQLNLPNKATPEEKNMLEDCLSSYGIFGGKLK